MNKMHLSRLFPAKEPIVSVSFVGIASGREDSAMRHDLYINVNMYDVCIYMHRYICIYICVYTYVYIYTHIHKHIYKYISSYLHIHIWKGKYIYIGSIVPAAAAPPLC